MPAPSRPPGAPVGRRVVLGLAGLGVAGVLGGGAVQRGLASVLGPIGTHDPTGLVGLIPVGDTFRFYSVTFGAPRRSAASYTLQVGGLVQRPAALTLADLQQLPQTELVLDFQCVTGWRVPQVRWSGVRLADVLDRAGVSTRARAVRFTSFDGTYTESLTLDQARRDDVLVALKMLDGPVTHDHGGPVRLFVGPMYGYKSLKWLGGIELTADVQPGYWEKRGYDVDGWVAPRTDATMPPPPELRIPADHSRDVLRFARAERWAHGAAGALTLVCIATAAILYNGMFAVLIGNRRLVELVHVWSGFALPVPLLVALLSRAYRSDLRRLGRFVAQDWLWLRTARRRTRTEGVGKFNAGQKLNGSLSAGSILVLLGTGTIMFFTGLAPLAQRTGATFVHDWFALAFGLLVVGHVVKALRDPQAMRGIRTGWVHRSWVHHEHPDWEAELAEHADRDPDTLPPDRERPPPPQE